MSEAHTPGPWRAVPQPGQTVGVHTYTHCVMYGDDSIADTLTEPDARLIAAAPDLLAACKAAYAFFHGDHTDIPPVMKIHDTLEAAIAKAGGAA